MNRVSARLALTVLLTFGLMSSANGQSGGTSLTFTYTYSGYGLPIPVDSAGVAALLQTNGLGLTEALWPEGQTTPSDEAFPTIAPVSAKIGGKIGGVTSEVREAALAAGRIGVYTLDIVIPNGVKSGAAEILVNSGEKSSQNKVTVQVK